MTRFEIHHNFIWNQESWKLGSNDEWTIELNYNTNIIIIREDAVGVYNVTGEFSIKYCFQCEWDSFEKDFNRQIGFERKVLCIKLKTKLFKASRIIIQGHIDFTEIIYKSVLPIQNEQSKDTQPKSSKESEESNEKSHQNHLERLSSDFEKLLDSQVSCFADVTLNCGDVSIPAHKNILSVRSPVFTAMFANPMKESIKNEVDIPDIDISIVRALLTYIYSGKISSDFTKQSAIDLMVAADKYQIEDLKAVCSDVLKDTVSLQNVLSILVLGDMIDDDLKSFAMDYISNRADEFSTLENTEEWRNLKREKTHLSMDVLTSMVKSLNTKSET